MNDFKPCFYCPLCQADISNSVIWGGELDNDHGTCLACGFSGELNSMTGYDYNGNVWQHVFEDETVCINNYNKKESEFLND